MQAGISFVRLWQYILAVKYIMHRKVCRANQYTLIRYTFTNKQCWLIAHYHPSQDVKSKLTFGIQCEYKNLAGPRREDKLCILKT